MKILFEDLDFKIIYPGMNLSIFKCRDPDLYDFLTGDALSSQAKRLSVTRCAMYNDQVVGFFTLVNDCIEAKAIEESDGDPGYPYQKYPAIKIARLATHDDYRNCDIGTNMLLKILIITLRLSGYVGCRIMTVDAKPGAVGFYQKFGFKIALRHYKDTVPMYKDYHSSLTGMCSEVSQLSQFQS
ncbi:MAG: GNAT family N-acetyltransferase [Methanoregula sp.]|jgi:GNAT superfamily N-acetyltransferase